MDNIDWYNATLIRMGKVTSDWRWCRLDAGDCPEGYFKVEGAIPIGVVKRGDWKGWPKWPKKLEMFWLKYDDLAETQRIYEKETGNCHKCQGTCKEVAGASVIEGTTYRTCTKCNGAGKVA